MRLQQRRHTLAATKRLFDLWHVFHLPLVWVMFAIVSIHVGVAPTVTAGSGVRAPAPPPALRSTVSLAIIFGVFFAWRALRRRD